jgi:predicted amidophosphoribosyltransferase
MGKSGGRVVYGAPKHGKRQHCLGCQRPIVYGDRCPDCQRELRQRKRRKPR